MKSNNIQDNIIQHRFTISKTEREKLLNQKAILLWFTGISGSGKSTIANELEIYLHKKGKHTFSLDGDNTRKSLNSDLDFTEKSRIENIRRIGEVAKLFLDAGIIVLASFISPYEKDRELIKEKVGAKNFIEIYVDCSLEEAEKRDIKGLYAKARKGEIKNFTGIDSVYEAPKTPNIVVHSHLEEITDSTQKIIQYLEEKKLV